MAETGSGGRPWVYDGVTASYTMLASKVTPGVVILLYKDALAKGLPSILLTLEGSVDIPDQDTDEFLVRFFGWFKEEENRTGVPYSITIAGLPTYDFVPIKAERNKPIIL